MIRCPTPLRIANLGWLVLLGPTSNRPAVAVETLLKPSLAVVRVGLATDQSRVVVADARGLEVVVDGEVVAASAQVEVRTAGRMDRGWTYRLQVAAMREPAEARRVAADFSSATGLSSDLAFDAATGLTRIRLGAWPRRVEAEREQNRLKAAGHDAWVVEEPGSSEGLRLRIEAGRTVDAASPVTVRPATGTILRWRGKRYRGALQVFLNRRGELNVVLASDVEDYLRGVIPREMGPRVYGDLQALKAQAVAARSYVLHNLGGFEGEGFDVCATSRCQAFAGVDAEHPMATRAVQETAGLVVATPEGLPADAMYTATCGGHTEDVHTVFPSKTHEYLRGVPCVEAGLVRLGPGSSWNLIENLAVEQLVGELGASPQEVGVAFRSLMERTGLAVPEDQLASFDGAEVSRFLLSVLDLVIDPAWLSAGAPLGSDAPLLAGSLRNVSQADGHVTLAELRQILYQLGEHTGLIVGREVAFLKRDGDALAVGRGTRTWRLGREVAWHWLGGNAPRSAAAGDPLHLILVDTVPLAVLVPDRPRRNDHAAPPTRVWKEFRSDADLAHRTATEFPGFEYRALQPGEVGVSGRLSSLILYGPNGSMRRLEGLPIRWFLDLPETLFSARRGLDANGQTGWAFDGRGWGHGVGMRQRGAYRMGLRGARFDEILAHYYSGLELVLYGSRSKPAVSG